MILTGPTTPPLVFSTELDDQWNVVVTVVLLLLTEEPRRPNRGP